MLFADICGFTRLVETVEPEVVYEVVQPLMDEMIRVVRRYGGEIQQILGDGFMAVFGLSPTHRTDRADRGHEAERAVGAGIALIGLGVANPTHPRLHIGVEYGEVLVTPSWRPATFGVWGRAVTVAKRLCDIAAPGEVQVGPAAFAMTRSRFRVTDPVAARLKGISDTVSARRVLGPEAEALAAVA